MGRFLLKKTIRELSKQTRVRFSVLDPHTSELDEYEQEVLTRLSPGKQVTKAVDDDVLSVFLGCNKALADIVGVAAPGEIVGKTDYDLCVTKEEADSYREYDRKIMDTDMPKLRNAEGG